MYSPQATLPRETVLLIRSALQLRTGVVRKAPSAMGRRAEVLRGWVAHRSRADVWESNDRGTVIGASHVGRPEPFSSIGSTLCREDRRVGPEEIRISEDPHEEVPHLLRFDEWAPSGFGEVGR